MWNGGVMDCFTVRVKAPFPKDPEQASTGVPGTSYQRLNCDRSTPEASCIACTKSSQVTACPSCRLKYRRIPAWNFSSPSRVCCMRTTSAPFSYTVAV